MDKRLMHYGFPRDQIQLDGTTVELHYKVAAVVADTAEQAVVQAIIEAARAEEFTDLYLLDKKFVADALREKLDRETPKPLTIQELIQMQDQPVWLKYLNNPVCDRWGIVEGASEIEGEKYLFLRGEYGYFEYGKGVVAYRYKPKEDSHGC